VTAAPLLDVRGATKSYGKLRALNDVSFAIAPGEIVGLIGPNGAGKSTLVDVISGRTRPNAGAITLDGTDLLRLPAFRIARKGVARTFQIPRSFRDATVIETVMVGALNAGGEHRTSVEGARELAQQTLRRVGLEQHADEVAERLDVAGRKHLQIAQALGLHPRLLLVDEVMAGLPPADVDAIVQLIGRLRDEGMTVLVIEHVMRAIAALADRILVLHHGEKIADDSPNAVFSDPVVMRAYLGPRFGGVPGRP